MSKIINFIGTQFDLGGFYHKLKSPVFYITYSLLSLCILAIAIFMDIAVARSNLNGYFETNNGFIKQLAQFNNKSQLYERLLELSSSIYEYEKVKKGNFFSAEIWSCDFCKSSDFPIWQINDTLMTEVREDILKNLNGNENFSFFNKYLFSANVIPIYSSTIKDNKIVFTNIFKVVFYKRILDLKIFGYETSFISALLLVFCCIFSLLIIFVAIPIHTVKRKFEKDIEKRSIISIKNLIEHTLINQENILKYGNDIHEKISKSLHHNNEAQTLLKNVQYEEIDFDDFMLSLSKDIYYSNNINILCNVSLKNKIFFCKNLLSLAFSTIIYNATHPSVKASNIYINIFQKSFSRRIFFEISNDGEEILRENRKKIFSGMTTKKDGHGLGLKNLKKLLNEAGSALHLLNTQKTTFSFYVKHTDTRFYLYKSFKLNKIDSRSFVEKQEKNSNLNKDLPLVVIIEDEELIWDAWTTNMPDANKVFFKTPDDFFLHSDVEKYSGRKFIENIKLIVCDYDFGNNINLSNSGFFNTLEREEEAFNGYFVLCTGFNESITSNISNNILTKIDVFFQKKPCSYNDILKLIGLREKKSKIV